jgi:hypothetical protein
MGAAGRVGSAGVTLRLAIAQCGARLWGNAAGARPRSPPSAGSAASLVRVRERGEWRRMLRLDTRCKAELCSLYERSRMPLEPFREGFAARLTGRHS